MGELQEKDLKPEQLAVVEWLAKPKKSRQTQEELAEELGVTSKTIWQWKKKDKLKKLAYERKREVIRTSDWMEIIDAQVEKAKNGNTKSAEFVRDWLGEGDGGKVGGKLQQINLNIQNIPRPGDKVDVDLSNETKTVDVGGD